MTRTAVKVLTAAALLLGVGGCVADDGVAPQPSEAVTMTPSIRSATVLTAPTYRLGPMPVTPTWQPAGEDGRPAYVDSAWFIRYRTAGLELMVQQGEPRFGDRLPETEHVPIRMLGLVGYRSTGVVGDSPAHTLYVVTTRDGLSVIVSGYDADVVRRFAEELRRQPMPMRPPFEVALLPERYTPSKVTTHSMEFVATPEPTDPNAPIRVVGVTLWKRYEFERPVTAIATNVNGNPAEVVLAEHQAYIRVKLANAQVLVVEASAAVGLDQQGLERLAEGVTITPDATAWTNEPS